MYGPGLMGWVVVAVVAAVVLPVVVILWRKAFGGR